MFEVLDDEVRTATILVYNQDECKSVVVHCPMPTSHQELWLYVLRVCMQLPDLQLSELADTLDNLGDDIMDFNIVALLPGYHEDLLQSVIWEGLMKESAI